MNTPEQGWQQGPMGPHGLHDSMSPGLQGPGGLPPRQSTPQHSPRTPSPFPSPSPGAMMAGGMPSPTNLPPPPNPPSKPAPPPKREYRAGLCICLVKW